MSRKAIIILIVITAIFVLIAFVSVETSPSLKNAFITDNNKLSEKELSNDFSQNKDIVFTGNPSLNIYALVFVKDITEKDQVKLKWIFEDDSSEKTIQEDLIKPENNGSGQIVVSLAKKDNGFENGNYKVVLSLNDSQNLTKKFTIK
ncbi:MAG: hypothetical protein KJ770_01760 [Actinobacteria bacterium]|nr:hypothetical protein [Actinomycetota bacterium]MCG2788708.1 hypothetical protein [Actinomycetes bacterium]